MKRIGFICLLLCVSVHIANSVKQSCREKNICVLKCGKETNGNVTWSRDIDGKREKILTIYKETVIKHITDPDRRYRSGAGLILSIFKFSPSDAGRYYCNENTVELSVIKTEIISEVTTTTVKKSCREKNICVLKCGKETNGNVTWSRDVDGKREKILTIYKETVIKHITDPDKRYSSGAGLILSIFGFSPSDAGRYYCNENTVELSVTSKTEIISQERTRSGKCSVFEN
ncbi:uncharacterized protein LOC117597929 [Pangasianodon hypophthalmus]|uniref:uncharacterized protein LOC117597929 n=1 Tax=Pangasianodon hypophthalmus TaxID=310915 RepID=UPI0023082601|nr:uncharacterized protein LOC117597929 [Pangasianodon hypophthalmus]